MSYEILGDTAWTFPTSGLWSVSANWSAGIPTIDAGVVYITNANSKTVTVDASAGPANLEIDFLDLSAPAGQTNTLRLESLGATPFRVIGVLSVKKGGAIQITNSTLFIDGNVGAFVDVTAGELTLLSGEINLTEFSRLRVGIGGTGVVNVAAGILNSADEFLIGAGLSGGNGIVNVTGGEVIAGTLLAIGTDPGTVGSMVVNGGRVVATNETFVTRIGDDGDGTLTLQSGSIEFGDVSVGRNAGGHGVWNISGGTADADDISVGRFAGAVGIINVSGGKLSSGDESLLIGREGSGEVNLTGGKISAIDIGIGTNNTASGRLTIAGGTMETSEFRLGSTLGGTGGIVTIESGALQVTNATKTAVLTVVNGTLTVNGGETMADSLLATNSTGTLQFNGGTIISSGTRVANGQPFVVGDGIRAATLRLDGGIHTFVNGLVISANASVIGCGQIVGTIQNNGVLSTNCGVAASPKLTAPARNQGQFRFTFQSESNVTYTVEYKQNLSDATWTKLQDYPGTGGAIEVSDVTADAMRFYRVVIY